MHYRNISREKHTGSTEEESRDLGGDRHIDEMFTIWGYCFDCDTDEERSFEEWGMRLLWLPFDSGLYIRQDSGPLTAIAISSFNLSHVPKGERTHA